MITITENYNGRLLPNDFLIGSSISSPFTPLINFPHMEWIDSNEVIYNKPSLNISGINGSVFRINDVLEYLTNHISLNCFKIGVDAEGLPVRIKVGKGYITDERDNILLILTAKSPKFNGYQITSRITYKYTPLTESQADQLCLFVSTAFVNDKKYALIYKKLEKDYISDAHLNNIEVRFTTSAKIEKFVYSNEFKVRMNTVEQLQSHLTESVGKILFIGNSRFMSVNPGLNFPLEEREPIYIAPITEIPPSLGEISIDDLDGIFGVPEAVLRRERVVQLIDDSDEVVDDFPF